MDSIFPRDVAPPQGQMEMPDLLRPGDDGYLKASDAGLFATEEELKDAAAGVALQGGPVRPALKRIKQGYEARLLALTHQCMAVIGEIDAGLREVGAKIYREGEWKASIEKEIKEEKEKKKVLEANLRQLDFEIETSLQEIRKARLEQGKKFFQKQGEYLGNEIDLTKQEVLQHIKDRREIAEEIYKLQKERWFTNKDELERRAQLFEKELNRVENRLGNARKRTANLHDQGITRTTANFLIWVGYISLAGVGGVIGSFFQKRQSGGGTDFLSLIFRGFISLAQLTGPSKPYTSPWSIILAPLPLVLLVVLYLSALGLIVWFMDGRMKKFDPAAWVKKKGRDNRRERNRLNLTDRFSSSVPTPEIDRKAYQQLLAYFPFVVLAALVVWLLAAGLPQAAGAGNNIDPTFGLAGAYLGIVFILLSTSVALLYTTKIIEPRWRKFENGGGARNTLSRYVKLNWEIVLLMSLLVASLSLTAVMPMTDMSWISAEHSNLITWGAVTIFMCLCSLGLAYGLIQRGLFRDEEFLERLRRNYRQLIETQRVGPTLCDLFEGYELPDEVKEATDATRSLLNNYREARHMLDEYRMIYELKEIFEDDFDEDPSILKVLHKLWPFRRDGSALQPHFSLKNIRLRAMPRGEPHPIDYVAAPQQTARLLTSRAARTADQYKLAAVDGELVRLEQEKAEAKRRLERLSQEVTTRRRRRLEVAQEYELKRSSLAEKEEKDLLKFQAAYTVGRLAYAQLKDELDLPSPEDDDSEEPASFRPM